MCKHQLACRNPAAGPLAPAGPHSHLLAPLLSPQRALPDDRETEAGTRAWGIVVLALEPQGPRGPQSPVFPFVWRQPRAGEGRQSLGERRGMELRSAALVSFRLACGTVVDPMLLCQFLLEGRRKRV